MPVIECKQCGKEFYIRPAVLASGKGLYCSRKCRSDYQVEKRTIPCPQCGKVFTKRHGQTFCSRSCSSSYHHAGKNIKKPIVPVCVVCGKEIKNGASKKTCSYECLLTRSNTNYFSLGGYSLFDDPYATGAIKPVRYANDLYREVDPVLGF